MFWAAQEGAANRLAPKLPTPVRTDSAGPLALAIPSAPGSPVNTEPESVAAGKPEAGVDGKSQCAEVAIPGTGSEPTRQKKTIRVMSQHIAPKE